MKNDSKRDQSPEISRDNRQDQTPEILGGPTDRRSLNVMLGTGFFNQVDQTIRSAKETGGVQKDKKQFLPWPLRVLSWIGGAFLLVGCVALVVWFLGMHSGIVRSVAAVGLGVGIPVYGGMRLLEAYLERRDWVRRMRQEDRQK